MSLLQSLFQLIEWKSTPTKANGDCLFESLSIVLSRDTSVPYSTEYLRSVVARSILESTDERAMSALEHFHTMYHQLKQSSVEYLFMKPSDHYPKWPLPLPIIQQISDNMMDRHLYWGEEYALRVFETQLQIRIFVLEVVPGRGVIFHTPLDHKVQYRPTHYLFLHLESRHYQPLLIEGKYLLQGTDLPSSLQKLIKPESHHKGWVLQV